MRFSQLGEIIKELCFSLKTIQQYFCECKRILNEYLGVRFLLFVLSFPPSSSIVPHSFHFPNIFSFGLLLAFNSDW